MSTSGLFDEPEGATPVDPGDAEGLIPTWVATRRADQHSDFEPLVMFARS